MTIAAAATAVGVALAKLTVFQIIMATLTLISVGMSVYSMLTAKGPSASPIPSPNSVGGIPTAEEGRAIPIVFGTVIIQTPNVVWWGNTHNTPNTVKM